VRRILSRVIGRQRHNSQPDVNILVRRTVRYPRLQLHDLTDPPYGFCMLDEPAASTAIRPSSHTAYRPRLAPPRRISWPYFVAAMVRSAAVVQDQEPTRCEAALLDYCSLVGSSGAAALRINAWHG
jgi:hypothetical protein